MIITLFFTSHIAFADTPHLSSAPTPQEEIQHSFGPMDTQDYKAAFFKMLLWIVLILGLVMLLLWLVKRFSNKRFTSLNQQKHIRVIEKRPISPKTILYVIEVGKKHLLISESQFEVEFLSHIQAQEDDVDEPGLQP